MTTHADLFLTCLRHYAAKDFQAISAMYAEDIHLRDWNISVHGKEEEIRETAKNFVEAESLEICVLATYENADTFAGELHIVVGGRIDLYVVDVMTFDAQVASLLFVRTKGGAIESLLNLELGDLPYKTVDLHA